ncbi:unnamed protein product [Microthlaspi erraticum]|uniref:Reverse transcriptase Ty1/copia-type domain-containing protein n=1 Tax=Microthlaspi erraticum TaxID=1685480 RepID=A0A6D2KM29_9BRAS|nr:unnamed protein product [Microthlaspi erraticum]
MDFIKTSSLRALIELTFQRNWNGLIWMSRKGVTTKRVKTVQTALSRISAQTAQPAGRETFVSRSAKTSVRLKSRPKFKPSGRHARPGKHVPRSASHDHSTPCRATYLTYHGRWRRPSRTVPRPAEKHRPIFTRPTTAADRIHPATTVPIAVSNPTGGSALSSSATVSPPLLPIPVPPSPLDPNPPTPPLSPGHNSPPPSPQQELPPAPSQPVVAPVPTRIQTRSKSGIVKPKKVFSLHTATISPLPRSHLAAFRDPIWNGAMHEEYNSQMAARSWTLVPQPLNANIVRSMWLYTHKFRADGSLARHKARLVANGKSQQVDIDCAETFSPVIKPATIRTILDITVSRDWPLHQLDVKNGFLHGNLEETVYMYQLACFVDPTKPDYVCLLKKSMYVLKQSPRAWYQ